MRDYVMDPPARPSLPVIGTDARFAVRRIYCVGRNYAEHAREMGHDPNREPPFFFSKPGDCLLGDDAPISIPARSRDLHHEVELVVALGAGGRDLSPEAALAAVWGQGIGIDLTLRDVQAEAKALRRPWDLSKGFDGAAVCGPLHPCQTPLQSGEIALFVNGDLRQSGDLAQMIWSIAEQIADLSTWVELKAGDLIYTGTPAGVGKLESGDHVSARISGLGGIDLRVA